LTYQPTELERARQREGLWLGSRLRLGQLLQMDELCVSYLAASVSGQTLLVSILNAELAGLPEFRQGFASLARAANALRSPAFGQVQEHGVTDEGLPYIAGPELLEGESLAELVRRRGRTLPPAEALRLIAELAGALGEAHGLGLVHGLLAPEQVFITEAGQIQVRSLGLSPLKLAAARRRGLSVTAQAAAFAAPEVASGGEPVAASDVWSLAALLFYSLTGQLPQGQAAGATQAPEPATLRPLKEVEPKSHSALATLLARAFVLEPSARPSLARLGAMLRHLGSLPAIAQLRFLGDSLPTEHASGPVVRSQLPTEPVPSVSPPPHPSSASLRPPPWAGRLSGGYSEIANAITSVTLTGLNRVSSPPGPRKASGDPAARSTRPPRR
jgi:serine/threonine protein kinase